MPIRKKTKPLAYIYLIDELKHHYDEVMDKYRNPEKYYTAAYTSEHRFFGDLERAAPPASVPHILIYVANRHLTAEDPIKEVLRFLEHLNTLSPGFEVIVVTSQKIAETERRLKEAGVISLIPDNENAMLRIDNLVKGSISRHTIWIKKKAASRALRFLGLYLLLVLAIFLVARLLYPDYF
jgi:hypothetical protein